MGNTTIFLHFGKLEVIFENGVKLTIISNAYPYEKKINEQCEIKEYNNDLWLKVGEKIEQNNDWIERFKELNADSFNEGDVEKSLKNFFTKIKERYRVTEITGYDIPLRQSGVNTWSVDERNAVSITLYDGDDYKLNGEGLRIFDRQAIRITENADYDIMVSEGYQIRLSHIDLTKNFISQFGEKQNEARINFQGYTFFGNILIIRDKEPAAYLPFLVFPSKVEPLDAERILDELIENMEEIIKSSPTHIPLEPRGWIEKSPLHTLILINNMFSETRKGRVSLGKTLSAIASSPDKRLLNEKIKKSSYEVTSVDDDSIMEAITTGGLKSGTRAYHHFKLENNYYLFVNLIDEISHISYDTPPNRFVKYFLEFLINTINGCIENIRERDAESIPLLEDFKESLIKNTLYYQKRYITPFLNLDWMNEVSRITYLPPPSQKLLKDPFYSNIFFDYIDLISNIKIVDEELEKYLHNPITWMPELYELWCKLKLEEIAEEKGIQFGYQSSYTKKSKSWISYSLSLCPDFSLTKGKHLIHLDAKYRTDFVEEWKDKKEEEIKEKEIEEKRGTFKLGDLYKMHTYREAILRKEDKKKPLWVIALYPGTKVALYSESLTSIELDVKDVKNDKIIEKDFFSSGGVGALSFTPSLLDDEKYKSWLNNLFDLLLEVENV